MTQYFPDSAMAYNPSIKDLKPFTLLNNYTSEKDQTNTPYTFQFTPASNQNYYFDLQRQQQKPDLQQEVKKLDERINKLEQKSKESTSGFFAFVYNSFTSKDNLLKKELQELKAARKAALENDGKIDSEEMIRIKKEFADTGEVFKDYRESKKVVMDITSSAVSVGAGLAAASLAPVTGGASLALVFATSAITKVASKEIMLGDEYDPFSKEAIIDGSVAGAFATTGAFLRTATRGATLLTKVETSLGNTAGSITTKLGATKSF